MYSDVFCKVYNVFGWNYYPEIFGQQLMRWLERKGITPQNALDLACGTGILCRILADSGIRTRGMDLSPGMISIAKSAGMDIAYDVADMTVYRPEESFDLVTCTGDALNHIPEIGAVQKIFENVFAYTNPGGWFVFDLLNEKEVSASDPFEMDFDEHTRVWFQMTRPAENKVNLKIRVFEDGQQRFEENIRETVHDPACICDLLHTCGFEILRCADSLLDDGTHGTTWFVIARKPK